MAALARFACCSWRGLLLPGQKLLHCILEAKGSDCHMLFPAPRLSRHLHPRFPHTLFAAAPRRAWCWCASVPEPCCSSCTAANLCRAPCQVRFPPPAGRGICTQVALLGLLVVSCQLRLLQDARLWGVHSCTAPAALCTCAAARTWVKGRWPAAACCCTASHSPAAVLPCHSHFHRGALPVRCGAGGH